MHFAKSYQITIKTERRYRFGVVLFLANEYQISIAGIFEIESLKRYDFFLWDLEYTFDTN